MCCNKRVLNVQVVTFEKWRLAAREGDAYQVDKGNGIRNARKRSGIPPRVQRPMMSYALKRSRTGN